MWEMYVAEGLADNRIAIIHKVHHVLADGVASANQMARAMRPAASDAPARTLPETDRRRASLLKAAHAKTGDTVSVTITPIKTWREPDVPADWQKAVATNKKATELWAKITPMDRAALSTKLGRREPWMVGA